MSKDSLAHSTDVLRPRHVGAPIKRTEDPRLLTGRGEYSADRKPDRALHVAFRRSEQSHAKIVRIDTTAAQGAPGVLAVFTAEDIAGDFKPKPVVYLSACAAFDLPPHACMMVAAHSHDLAAASALGLRTAHVARPNEHGPGRGEMAPTVPVDFAATGLTDLAAQLAD